MLAFHRHELVPPPPKGYRISMEMYRLSDGRVTEYAEVVLEVPAAAMARQTLSGPTAQEFR